MHTLRYTFTAVVAVVVLLVGAGVADAAGPAATAQRIRFAPGTTAATVHGTTDDRGTAPYVFGARAGQTAHITFDAPDTVTWTLVSPDGQPLKTTMTEARDGSFDLPACGDHRLTVTGAPDTAYTLRLRIPAG